MPLWQYAVLFLPFLISGLGLQALYSPVATGLAKQLFGWMPVYLLQLPSPLRSLTAITLITALLTLALDGIISPIVEELYFRGYLCHVSRTGNGLRRSSTRSCSLCNITGNPTMICSFFS